MKKIAKVFILFILCYIGASTVIAQPNYRQALFDTTANFYTIRNDFFNWYDTIDLPDSLKSGPMRHFSRWASMFEARVQSNEPDYHGSFKGYTKALGTYWLNPSCTMPDNANWQNIGPFPADLHDMGFIQSIWVHPSNPSTMLVGSGRISGILKSTNFGETWYDVLSPSRIPALGITYISSTAGMDHNLKSNIYASTGSDMTGFSVGILKSEDEGETWEVLENFPPYANQEFNYVVEKVLKAPGVNFIPDVIYAITNTKFYSSTDGGISWTWYDFGFDGGLKDLEVDPNNKDVIAVSGDPNDPGERAKIWLSTDGGISFVEILGQIPYQNLSNIQRVQIDFPSSDRLYMLTREPNKTGRVFYYNLSLTTPEWDITNMYNYYATGKPGGGGVHGGQFNRAFHVTEDYQTYYIGTENLSIAQPGSDASIVPVSQFPYHTTANTHCDIRCIYVRDGNIWLGTDGGVTHRLHSGTNWISLNGKGGTGITNNEIVGFDITEGHNKRIVVGMIDNSVKFYRGKWHSSTPVMLTPAGGAGSWLSKTGIGDAGQCCFNTKDPDNFYIFCGYGIVSGKLEANDEFTMVCNLASLPDIEFGYDWYKLPITASRHTPSTIYVGGRGFSNPTATISKSYDLDLWENIPMASAGAVNNIAIAPSNHNIIYATTDYITWSGANCFGGIFRSTDGGETWSDITGGNCNNAVKNQDYFITSIAVDWNNPNKVWVSMSGVPYERINGNKVPFLANRVFRTDDASANPIIWIDMTNDLNGPGYGVLPPLPTTAIVNQPGTDRVFLATDGGIFYRGDNDPDWTCFSNGFPITHITDLKIDRVTNEIYASTYGYSVFKADLPCPTADPVSYAIEEDVVWSNLTKTISGDIYVISGNTLTINNKTVVNMSPGSNIYVEVGAKLIVDNATLTSCGGMWQGITVRGQHSQHQNEANQGVVHLLNGATIANARVGIETGRKRGTGGIIQAENSGFYNCEYAIKMHPYRNFNPGNQNITFPNRSYFKECTFATTSDLLDQGVHPKSHIWLDGIQHLSVQGNTFENQHPNQPIWNERGTGIVTSNSTVFIHELCTGIAQPCFPLLPNRFIGLNYGVYSMADNPLRSISVDNALFDKNRYGVYYGGIYGASVTRSEFLIPPDLSVKQRSYGLYLDNCTGYTIEENHFQNAEPLNNSTVGLIVNNSGADFNELYNNTFHDLGWGILAQHDNRGVDEHTGLKVKCNDFSEIIKLDVGISMSEDHTGVTGISEYQGGNFNVKSPAGNTFSWAGTNPLSDINNNGLVISKYFHHDIQGQTPAQGENWVPVYYDPYKVLLERTNLVYQKELACPLRSGLNPLSIPQLYSQYHDFQIEELSADLILAIFRDGGLEELPELVELAYPHETYYYYNLLISESPYLSDQTMIAAINNTDLLPDLLLKLVLMANPHCTRSDEVMGALETREPQLPQYMVDEIMLGEDMPSPLEGLEAAVAYWVHNKQMTLHQIIRTYMSDTTTTDGRDSLMSVFAREESPLLKLAKTFLYFSEHDYDMGMDWFEGIESLFMDHEYFFQQYAEYALLLPIVVEMQRDSLPWEELSVEQINDLYYLANEGLHYPSAYARTLLLQYDSEYQYEEPIIFPYTQLPRKRRALTPPPFDGIPELNVYPNPANHYLIVDYGLNEKDLPALLRITNAKGQLMEQIRIEENTGKYVINCQDFTSGIYFATLISKQQQTTTRKVTITR